MTHVQGQTGCSERRACAVLGQHRSTQRDGHRMTRERRRTRRHGLIGVLPTGVTSPRNITPSMFCGDTRTGGYAQYFARKSHELIAIAPRRGRLPCAASAVRNRRINC